MNEPCVSMAQLRAINTRKVNKVNGHDVFHMVKNMTGVSDAEILKVITPEMVPMIGRNEAHQERYWRSQTLAQTWDSPQQVSWGNALKWIKTWLFQAGNWPTIQNTVRPIVGSGPTTIPRIISQVEQTPFPPLTTSANEADESEKILNLLVQSAPWNDRKGLTQKYKKMSHKKLKNLLDNIPQGSAHSYPFYNKDKRGRYKMVTEYVANLENTRKAAFYQDLWTKSGGAADPAVLLMMARIHPTYYMAWIIAKTYHMNNPEVKIVSGYEGRYKYRNWELKERYYPAMGKGDTLPKTTAGWPRYSAAPAILNDFTMQEVAKALKSDFGGVLTAKENEDKAAIQKAVDGMKTRKDQLVDSAEVTLQQILSQGLDTWNKNNLVNYAYYYTPKHKRKQIPANKMNLVSYADLRKKMGTKKYNKTIKEYESKQKGIRDSTIDGANLHYDQALSNVAAAKGSKTTTPKATGKSKPAVDAGFQGLGSLFG